MDSKTLDCIRFNGTVEMIRDKLFRAIAELRAVGGSGVVVTPVTYIFEEEPARCRAMMEAICEEVGSRE